MIEKQKKMKKKQDDRYRGALYEMTLSETALLKDDYSIEVTVGVMARLVLIMDNPEHIESHQLMEAVELIKKYRSSQRSHTSFEELINMLLEDT